MAQDHSSDNSKLPAVGADEAAAEASATDKPSVKGSDNKEAKSKTPDSDTHKKSPPPKAHTKAVAAKKPRRSALAVFCLLLIVLLAGATAWFGWQMWQQLTHLEREVATGNAPVAQPEPFDASAIESDINSVKRQLGLQGQELQKLQAEGDDSSQLNNLARQQAAMERRLEALSDTSRDDWKLAEAAFLLRLASQRMLIEHNSSEAIALTQAADTILRDQQDPDLFGVRQTLARELTALKMVEPVDREGLYARVQALIEQIENLDELESYQRSSIGPDSAVTANANAESVWQKIKASFNRAFTTLGSYIRVRDREQKITPLLPPEQRYFLTQNLRLMLEQAQLALLREQPQVYEQSLSKAQQWIAAHFEQNNRSDILLTELAELEEEPIVVELPDINDALGQLRAYIDKLHKIEAGGTP
ncbi:uroporphyrinogen-III C-methyltransferase [uncultured Gilvimarinus sp.]|uniref:uroporphyrinogen-III C-methyltransferase n=1 Tax=uncultured Gilvimarinus sp. TaxID=1689143 RepID=UPI0030ED892E